MSFNGYAMAALAICAAGTVCLAPAGARAAEPPPEAAQAAPDPGLLEARVAQLEARLGLAPLADLSLDQRVARIEVLLAKPTATTETVPVPVADEAAGASGQAAAPTAEVPEDDCGDAVDVPVTTAFYGNINLQWQNSRTQLAGGGTKNYSDIHQYDSEIGVDTSYTDWSGHFSLGFDDTADAIAVKEGYIKFQRKDHPWYFQAGLFDVGFSNNPHFFPTYSAAKDLGDSTLRAIGGGYDNGRHALSAFLYNPPVDVAGQSDVVRDYVVDWDVTKRAADECHDGWQVRLGYNSNLPQHDLRLSPSDPLAKRLPGMNAFAGYDFHAGCGLVHVLADYTGALQRYAAADLDANGDGVGDRPQALNTELVYEPRTDHLWGVSYQSSGEMADYAAQRWGLLYGRRLDKLAMLKVEYTHGTFNSYATAGQRRDDTLVGEINLSF